MKKLFQVLVLTLAVNFLAVIGAVGWLFLSGKLDRARVTLIREMLFATEQPPEVPATQPTTQSSTRPSILKLDELLEKYAGRRAGEQVEVIQQSIDAQAVTLDRRSRELDILMRQILREKEELALKSRTVEADRQRLIQQEMQQAAEATDKGFQDSLKLLTAMPGKQAKSAFMEMPDEMVVRYLQSMPPRTATRIIKEFKTPEEQARMNAVLERMRQGNESPSTQPAAGMPMNAAVPSSVGVHLPSANAALPARE